MNVDRALAVGVAVQCVCATIISNNGIWQIITMGLAGVASFYACLTTEDKP